MLQSLSRPRTLWFTFISTVALTLTFGVVMKVWDFGIIDEMYHAEKIRAHIDAMNPQQRSVHAWMTGTLDVAYPLIYGAFFIGVAVKAFGRYALWLALPSIGVIPADLIEGFAQIMLLTGHENFMAVKLIATPTKLVLFVTGLLISVIGLLRLGMLKLRE